MSKSTRDERNLVKSIVASLTIKRIPEPEPEIIKAIFDQTNKTITKRQVTWIRQSIKRDSFQWYKTMREGEYEYIHEFKERINEILFLQKKTSSNSNEKRRQPTGSTNIISRTAPLIYYVKQFIRRSTYYY